MNFIVINKNLEDQIHLFKLQPDGEKGNEKLRKEHEDIGSKWAVPEVKEVVFKRHL